MILQGDRPMRKRNMVALKTSQSSHDKNECSSLPKKMIKSKTI